MKTHDLAKKLLEMPNVNVAVSANGHFYSSFADSNSHGKLKGAMIFETKWSNELQCSSEPEQTLVIGNMLSCSQRTRECFDLE